MNARKRGSRLIHRSIVGVWFCGIGALGLLRFFMRAFRGPQFEADTVAWLWLAGAIVMMITGIAAMVYAARRRDATTNQN